MEDRYRAFHDLLRWPVSSTHALVYSPYRRQSVVISQRDLVLLLRCTEFAPLSAHAAHQPPTSGSVAASIAGARRQLDELVACGLLVSERSLVEGLSRVERDDEPPPPISTIGIPTGGRDDFAVQAVASVAVARAGGPPIEVVVAHDAKNDAESARLVAALGELSFPGIELRYLGPRERAEYATRLAARAHVEPELVGWALTRQHPATWGTGALRNSLMLDAMGKLGLQLDDDIRCEVGPGPNALPGIALTSTGSGLELHFPAAGASADELATLAPGDPSLAHQQLLGRRLGDCLARFEPADASHASGVFVREVMSGQGVVRCTQMGLLGDSATGSLGHYFWLQGASRERLVSSEAVYEHAIHSRQGVRCAQRPTIGDGGFFMTYAVGLDHRAMLPPFMPEGRNGDGVFGVALRLCFRDSYVGHLPEVIAHRPPPRRSSMEEIVGEAQHVDSNDLVCRVLTVMGRRARGSEPSLEHVGAELDRLERMPLGDLEEWVRTLVIQTRSRDVAALRQTLAQHGSAPAYWARDVTRLADSLAEAMLREDHAHPRDLIATHGAAAGRAAWATVVGRYGRLLMAWPAIDRAARELAAEGERPSRVLAG